MGTAQIHGKSGGGGGTNLPIVGTYTGKGNSSISLTVPTEVKVVFIIGNSCFLALKRGETKAIVIGGNNGRSSEKIHITKVKVTWSGTTAYISEDKTVEFGVDGKTSIQSYSIPGWDAAWIEYIYIMF